MDFHGFLELQKIFQGFPGFPEPVLLFESLHATSPEIQNPHALWS